MRAPAAHQTRLSADVGGTFTDIAVFDEVTGSLRLGKTLTTPRRLVNGIAKGVGKAESSFAEAQLFLHGTTIAINTILERNGARAVLLTTQGFRDIYEIGRVNRPESYNLFFQKHVPLIERSRRYEIRERMDAEGRVLIPVDEDQVRAIVAEAVKDGIEAVAILFLHSYRNPAHERRVKEIIETEHPGLFVTASHELSQEYREFERTSTVAANAYIGPRVRHYLGEMRGHLRAAGFAGDFFIVQSSGGLFDIADAQRTCIRMLESGPAAGVIGTKALCDATGIRSAIAFDMGGTTAKTGVIHDGQVLMTGNAMVGGYVSGLPVQMPMVDIQEVGTGSGSIARVETGRALRVGPQSAGAEPGPVCYGLGGQEPTITDANLVLGRLGVDRFLGGEMPLDLAAAIAALRERIADPLNLDPIAAAEGILRIATTRMSHVVRCRFRAGRLWRRRAAARRDDRSRTAHRPGGDPDCPGTLLGFWHAGHRFAPRLRQDLVHATGRCVLRVDGGDLPGYGRRRPRGGKAERHRHGECHDQPRRRPALCRPGARRDRRAADGAVPQRGSGRHQTPFRCHPRRPLWSRRRTGAGRDCQLAQRRHRTARQAALRAHHRRGRCAAPRGGERQPAGVVRRARFCLDADFRSGEAARRQSPRRAGAGRGARVNDGIVFPGDALTVDEYGNLVIAIARS